MPIGAEALYRQLGTLVAEFPTDLSGPGPLSEQTQRWLGRASALLTARAEGDHLKLLDQVSFTTAVENILGILREGNVQTITAILHRALASAELNAPVAAQGAFVPAQAAFNAFQAIGNVLQGAQRDALIVDAYMDETVLTDFAPLSREGVSIRLLYDSRNTAPTLTPAVRRWTEQFAATRPLAVRATLPRVLHDRLIVLDGEHVWSLTQSLKDFARRSPASLLHVDTEIAVQKVEAYEAIWNAATPM